MTRGYTVHELCYEVVKKSAILFNIIGKLRIEKLLGHNLYVLL